MPPARKKPMCFVIMPFGKKRDGKGTIDFDDVYKNLIKNTIGDLGFECVRCDELVESGRIHRKMFQHVYGADVAVVDITQLNANVFYELGVRHALASHTTVLIKKRGTKPPFNIGDLDIIEYDLGIAPEINEEAKRKIRKQVQRGYEDCKEDSPVHEVLDFQVLREPRKIRRPARHKYRIDGAGTRRIGLVAGDLLDVNDFDVWVSPENTEMEPARLYDRSISSAIRYHGATCDGSGQVVSDTIKDALTDAVTTGHVPPAHVVPTISGALAASNNVKRIFHVAAVQGQPGKGYSPIENMGACVRNALERADASEFDGEGLRSMLFPLLGTGTARGNVTTIARDLIYEAINQMQRTPPRRIEKVFFIVPTEEQLTVCQRVLAEHSETTLTRR